ncbi:MAG TPA: ASPIC/UnbV domain-containing protein, partial [Pyrinomonadaceae bacterium]|nr:ASPIC/UnbV domain-containing protein [Pyrinomonadaceae bacterium]
MNQVGNRNHWLGLRLVGKNGRDALGAQVDVTTSSGTVLRRRVRTDGSYLCANDPRVLVGLGAATSVKSVRVRWPNGTSEEWKSVAIDRYTTLKEGTSRD